MPFGVTALNIFLGVAWATTLLWVVGLVLTWRGITQQKLLPAAPLGSPLPTDAPLVSVLIPARNEEKRVLAACVRSITAQDYPRLEVIAVNDRSTDATGEILRRAAAADDRLKVIDGAEPPAGWLGKPHALAQALGAARGSWVLATDADMIYEPQAVRTAVLYAAAGHYDALTLMPRVDCLSFWERVFMPTFGWFMVMALPIARVNDPRRAEALGVGGFFLIKRSALERIGGYAGVRGEVAEDLRTAERLKAAGARLRVEFAPDLIRTRMQTNLAEIWEGFTKNLFAGAKFSLWRSILGSLAVSLFSVLPPIAAAFCAAMVAAGAGEPWPQLLLPLSATWLLQFLTFAAVNKAWEIPLRYAPLAPLGHALFVAILLNSATRIATGRGVTWKGRVLYDRAAAASQRRPPATSSRGVADEP